MRAPSTGSGGLHSGQEQGDQDANDGDDDQKFH
jgi:hypothetical protein